MNRNNKEIQVLLNFAFKVPNKLTPHYFSYLTILSLTLHTLASLLILEDANPLSWLWPLFLLCLGCVFLRHLHG